MENIVVDYGVAYTAALDIYITANPEAVATAFTPAAGDTKISTNYGVTYTSTTNTCTFANGIISVVLTATEMQAARILLKFEDQDAALVSDKVMQIFTKNHASAFYTGIDINTDASGNVTLAAATHTGAVIPTVSTLTGHTAQTGDTYALANGAAGFVAIDTVVDTLLTRIVGTLAAGTHNPASAAQIAVLSDWIDAGRLDVILDAIKAVTDAQAATGTGLTAIPWNAAWDAEVQSEVNDGLVAFFTSAANLVDLIWDEPYAAHLTAGTMGLSEVLGSVALIDTTLAGTPTTTTFQLTAGSTIDDFYNDQSVYILSGTGAGQVRVILDYTGATKTVTVDEPWITTPAAADRVAVLVGHVHPITQITADIDANSTQLAAIVADTNELQGDWTNTGRLDTILDELTTQGDTNETKLNTISTAVVTTIPGLIDDIGIKKNTAFSNFEFLMVLTSDHVTPATGLTVTGQRSIDGGAFAAVAGTIAEVSNGIYQFDALAADTNGDVITWRFSSATADDAFYTFKTVA